MPCPKIRVGDTFPASTRDDLSKVADSLRRVIDDVFGHRNPPLRLPIVCISLSGNPRTSLDSWSAPTEILIHLSTEGRHYSQFAFQLAHEIGHVYAGVYRNNGAIETIAAALSLEALGRLARRWKVEPPHSGWIDYASNFQEYRTNWEDSCIDKCPAEIREAAAPHQWDAVMRQLGHHVLRNNTSEEGLISDEGRALQTVAAMALLSKPLDWSQFIGIENGTAPGPDVSREFMYSPFDRECIRAKAPSILWLAVPE